jgi:hypothetical protein
MPPQQGRRCVGPCNWDAGEADAQMTGGGVHSSTNVRKRVCRGRGHRRECDAGGGQGLAATPHGSVDGTTNARKWESRRGGEGGASAGDEVEAASERGGGCEDFHPPWATRGQVEEVAESFRAPRFNGEATSLSGGTMSFTSSFSRSWLTNSFSLGGAAGMVAELHIGATLSPTR